METLEELKDKYYKLDAERYNLFREIIKLESQETLKKVNMSGGHHRHIGKKTYIISSKGLKPNMSTESILKEILGMKLETESLLKPDHILGIKYK